VYVRAARIRAAAVQAQAPVSGETRRADRGALPRRASIAIIDG
jgi:hypothetical protein